MKASRWVVNPNRNMWLNNGYWWMRITPWHPTKTERVAINLRTKDVEEARRRRDELIAANGWRVAA
jgi:hypothetical protein